MSSAVAAIWRARSSAGSRRISFSTSHDSTGATISVRERADLRLLRAAARWKARLEISSETVKPTPAKVPPASSTGGLTGARGPCSRGRDGQPRAEHHADRLADHVAGEDPERDRRAEGGAQQAAAEMHAGVGEREQRHDHVAGPRVQLVLEPLVG